MQFVFLDQTAVPVRHLQDQCAVELNLTWIFIEKNTTYVVILIQQKGCIYLVNWSPRDEKCGKPKAICALNRRRAGSGR